MKKVKSYSLSTDAIKRVIEVKEKGKYKSESDALEAIILQKENDVDKIKKIVLEVLKENQLAVTEHKSGKELPKEVIDEVEEMLKGSMNDIFNQMK